MTKSAASLALLAALLVPVAASAQNSVAYRVGPGAQMTCGTAVPTHVSTRGTVWCKSTDSNKLHYTDPSGTDIALGAGGGGTSTLTASYAAGSSTASSIMALDSTRGPLVLRDNAATIGALFNLQNSGGTTTYASLTGNASHTLRSGMADGATAISLIVDTTSTWANGSARFLSLRNNGTERYGFKLTELLVPSNWNLTASSAASTNTTSMTLQPNVAEGASSVALRINNQSTLSSGTLLQIQNNGTTVLTVKPTASDGVKMSGGSAFVNVDSTNGALLGYGSNYLFVGVTSITATGLPITSDGTSTSGTSSTPWPVDWAKWRGVTLGTALTSAATITPTSAMHHMTGTVSVTTIATTNLPTSFVGSLTIVCDAACVFATGGNISTGFTGTANKAYVFWWDGTAWRVQGGG